MHVHLKYRTTFYYLKNGVKTGLNVSLSKQEHEKVFIAIGLYLGLVPKAVLLLSMDQLNNRRMKSYLN